MIEISGNNLLNDSDYLLFTRLNDLSFNHDLTLRVIKDRFEKHPYVSRVEVEENGNKAKITLSEKKIMAVILNNTDPYFISEDFQVLPMFSDTKLADLPVIRNSNNTYQIKPLDFIKNSDVIDAFKIIEAAKRTNMNIYKRISEIDLRNGGDIILNLTGIKTPIVFGRGEEARKMIYLEIMWDGILDGNSLIRESDYIDLRFADEVYIKGNEITELSE
ncbi:MAG: cell division protein FtsQ/DivIB [Ignavibacteriaceae bacterium]|nr:cell division protein FtsQ/DivIB [Ignavibacteriaceae bacterium]